MKARLTPPESRRLRLACSIRGCRESASRPPESRRLRRSSTRSAFCRPPHAPGIAATAAPALEGRLAASRPPESRRLRRSQPPHAPGIAATAAEFASRPPESRRLRLDRSQHVRDMFRLTPPGIAATAATCVHGDQQPNPPHAPRNRGDCGIASRCVMPAKWIRLTPPESRRLRPMDLATPTSSASRPPESRRLRPEFFRHPGPPHAPRNRGDCGN